MTALLNCVVGGKDIKKIENNKGLRADKLEFGFEFGTWDYPPYYKFFQYCGNIPTEKALHQYVFNQKEKEGIKKKLKQIIKKAEKMTPEQFAEKSTKEEKRILSNLPIDHWECITCHNRVKGKGPTKYQHNPFTSHTKTLIEKNHINPLLLNSIDHYKKLLKIFEQKQVKIVN